MWTLSSRPLNDREFPLGVLNDYVEIVTGAGKHKGYIKFFLYGKVRVNCMAGEFCVPQNSVSLNAAILTEKK